MTRASLSRLAAVAAISSLPLTGLLPTAFAQSGAVPANSEPIASSSSSDSGAASSGGSQSASPRLSQQMSQKVDKHIQNLRDELQITQSEEPQWKQFAQVMRSNATTMEQAFSQRSSNLETMNAMQNMQSYADLAQVHATNMQKLASAFQALYNTFPPSQKQIVDQVFRERHEKMQATKSGG